ncbi:hypothetical protein Poli38472_005484 [Pythium oligandrum]|uniref:CFA20 domain-containing protein n=1 Tax=Pythium oligandrum TaxID=41045 RepID=A0A8K1FHL5_PYTOL|nr:hypothetical protein Poli38472_005484 [Pythium oligandrum]|eukprot:TMW62866.1 hypothetical protein Poli38472_005484 [Pythium oligandrum]
MTSASYFQGGNFVELLSAQGKAPASTWRLQGKIIKSFDKNIKGNAYQMEGSAETKMQLPKTPTSSSLGLSQRFVVFQILVPFTRAFSLEIGYADFDKSRRRLVFASAFRETTTTALHAQIPLGTKVPRDQWINLVVDMQALTELYIPGSSFRSMESVCISGSCRLKRIFTMKDAPRSDALVSMLNMPTTGKKTSKATPVAAYTDMKDIPRQFIFSVGASNMPIPTEYFLPDVVPSIEEVPVRNSARGSKAVATARGKAAKDGLAEKKPLARVPSNMRRDRENDVAPPSAKSHEHNTIDDALEEESEGNLAKSYDFSSSPVPIRHISETKQSTLGDPEPSVPKPGADHANEEENEEDDEDLSLDLTDELEEPGTDETEDPDQDALVSPTEGGDGQDDDVPADDEDEQSFNFDDLVAQEAVIVTAEEDKELVSTSQQVLRASVESKRGENQSSDISHPTSSHRSPHIPTERRSHEPRMSQTSSERRLASLLESTDWSQLPLASLVKPSSKEDRPKTSKSHRDSVNATTSSPARASTPSTSIELVYDPILRCYYDPIGKKYYTLAK